MRLVFFSEEMRRQFAEKSFKIIGREIKTRRMADFHDIMSSRLPKDFNIEQSDPALNNAEIEQVLQDNHRDATIKTEKVRSIYHTMINILGLDFRRIRSNRSRSRD